MPDKPTRVAELIDQLDVAALSAVVREDVIALIVLPLDLCRRRQRGGQEERDG
jgi:hypothetical protein